MNVMNDKFRDPERDDEDILAVDFSDEALEAAARVTAGPVMSLPGAPTVSILVACCSNDEPTKIPSDSECVSELRHH
jgi:hypothetical protein